MFWVSTVIYTPLVQVDTNSKRSWSTVAFRDTPGCSSVSLEQYVQRVRVYANPLCRSPQALLLPAVPFRALCPRPLVAEEHPTSKARSLVYLHSTFADAQQLTLSSRGSSLITGSQTWPIGPLEQGRLPALPGTHSGGCQSALREIFPLGRHQPQLEFRRRSSQAATTHFKLHCAPTHAGIQTIALNCMQPISDHCNITNAYIRHIY